MRVFNRVVQEELYPYCVICKLCRLDTYWLERLLLYSSPVVKSFSAITYFNYESFSCAMGVCAHMHRGAGHGCNRVWSLRNGFIRALETGASKVLHTWGSRFKRDWNHCCPLVSYTETTSGYCVTFRQEAEHMSWLNNANRKNSSRIWEYRKDKMSPVT